MNTERSHPHHLGKGVLFIKIALRITKEFVRSAAVVLLWCQADAAEGELMD